MSDHVIASRVGTSMITGFCGEGASGSCLRHRNDQGPVCRRLRGDVGDDRQTAPRLRLFAKLTEPDMQSGVTRILRGPRSPMPQSLDHYAVSRIMPHGRALRRANLFRVIRQFGIIEPSGNDEVWWETDWRLQEFVFDCRNGLRSHRCEQPLSGNGSRLLQELGAFGRKKLSD